jgi:phosphatidylglycerophosphate synthase
MDLSELQNVTAWVVVLFIAGILLYDVYAFYKGGVRGTVSYMVIMTWSRKYPAFTFMVGFVMGHLFWPLSTCVGG